MGPDRVLLLPNRSKPTECNRIRFGLTIGSTFEEGLVFALVKLEAFEFNNKELLVIGANRLLAREQERRSLATAEASLYSMAPIPLRPPLLCSMLSLLSSQSLRHFREWCQVLVTIDAPVWPSPLI